MALNYQIKKRKVFTIAKLLAVIATLIILVPVIILVVMNTAGRRERLKAIREGQPIVEAIYRYRNAKGMWPENIADFVPAYFETMPNDLWYYSDGSLRRKAKDTRHWIGYNFTPANEGWICGRDGSSKILPDREYKMEIVSSDKFRVAVPKKYKVICHDIYKEQAEFFKNISQYEDGNEEIVDFIRSHPPDLDVHKGSYSYEVKMGKHSFIFHTEIGSKEPEYMAAFIENQTREAPVLEDIECSGINGKKNGSYSEEMSWIAWWLKKGDCMICFNFQGMGMPSDEIKEDVSHILNSLEYIP